MQYVLVTRETGYRPSRVNIMAQGLSTPDPSLSPTHLSIRRGRATTTQYTHTHHQVSLMVSRNTTLVPSLGLRIGPACEPGLSAGMRRERVSLQIRREREKKSQIPGPTSGVNIFCKTPQFIHSSSTLQTDSDRRKKAISVAERITYCSLLITDMII